MTDASFVAAGWIVSFGAVAAYAIRVIVRGRRLSERVPEDERRWS